MKNMEMARPGKPSGTLTDPVLSSAAQDWSKCMAAVGYTATLPDQLASAMIAKRPQTDVAWTVPSAREVTTALDDWACQLQTDFVNRWYGRWQQVTSEFAAQHGDLIASIKRWQDGVTARAQAAIDALHS